jgi:hypothetical protein
MEYNGYQLWTPNNLHFPPATADKVTAVLSSNHVYLLRTVLYWLKPPYTTARVSVTNVKLCHDLPSGLSWNGRVKLSDKQAHTDLIPPVWDLIWGCWGKDSWCSEGKWHLHLPGSSKFLDCLTLQVTMLQHCGTSHKTWNHSSALLWEKDTYTPTVSLLPPYIASVKPWCHQNSTLLTLCTRFIQILNKSVTNIKVWVENAWLNL